MGPARIVARAIFKMEGDVAGSLNKVTLIGNLGKDPEIRSMINGNKVANFSIATSESWRDKSTGERKETTEWHRCVCFNEGLIKVIEQYVRKGDKLYIEGKLQTRKWTDQAGVEKYSTEIVLGPFNAVMIMLGSPQGDGDTGGRGGDASGFDSSRPQRGATSRRNQDFDDDIPF